MAAGLPALTGKQLINLLKKDGWVEVRGRGSHVSLKKPFGDRTRRTVVENTGASLPRGTLAAILGVKQTGLGRAGLLGLIDKYGV